MIKAFFPKLDFCKAFDIIEWPMIQQVPSIFNFGVSNKRWTETFYCNAESSVINNGFTTRQLKLSRGVRHGCPLSPYLFIYLRRYLPLKYGKIIQFVAFLSFIRNSKLQVGYLRVTPISFAVT